MVDFTVTHPLDQFLANAPVSEDGGVSVSISSAGLAIAQLFAAKGKSAKIEQALKIKQSPGKATISRSHVAIPISPGQWLLVSRKESGIEFANGLRKKIGSDGFVSEQSDSRVIFSLSGPRVAELMQKGCRLDLHPSQTGKGWCAQTQMAQCGVVILQTDDAPKYDVMVYSGFARHFAEWLAHTGQQLGIGFSKKSGN